uniref:Erythromycin biosynthesis protein CIII-like C-terminal domain-containing protein n=1 Tax=Calcidiscus leptoporus TaxID=127549 RepID=A0A7S0J9G5_9EUKA
MVRKAGVKCVAASENVADLLEALGAMDLSDMGICNLIKIVKALAAYKASPAHRSALQADNKAGYELALAFKPDVILLAGFEYGVWASVGEALGVPVVRYDLQPNYPTTEIGFFKREDGSMPKCLNKLAYEAFNKKAIAEAQRPRALELRTLAGLSHVTHSDGSCLTLPPELPQLCAMSPSFVPQPSDWPSFKEMVGYWMMPPTIGFEPSEELADFLARDGGAPVYIGFGSMKGSPAFCTKLSTMAIAALAHAQMRGILLGGWAGLTAQVLDTSTDQGRRLAAYAAKHVLELPACPHDWLFPRCAAVVHHGGAGTTSVGLRAGRPTIICAVTGDQPWHGSLVAKKQLGLYAGTVSTVTGTSLGELLLKVVADPEIASSVAEMSRSLAAENGTLRSNEFIERAISTFPYPWLTRKGA